MASPQPVDPSSQDNQPPPTAHLSSPQLKTVGLEDSHDVDDQPNKDVLADAEHSKKRKVVMGRDAGRSLLPTSRVHKIMKADRDLPSVAKEAIFLISLATEEFIKRLGEAGQRVAERERRTTVQHRDIATVVRRIDEFVFLEEIIPWAVAEGPARRKAKAAAGEKEDEHPTLMDQFLTGGDKGRGAVVVNEDGTMQVEYNMDVT